MPTLLTAYGFRFFFYSNETDEPAHVHVVKGDATGKVWLEPHLEIVYLNGFTNSEEKRILQIIGTNLVAFKNKWYAYFKK